VRFLRSNTAVLMSVGPFYDRTDGVTIETALTITNERITLTADTDAGSAPTNILDNVTGATSGTANDLNYITGNDAGLMQLELAAADVNRVGRMFLSITDAANHVPVFHELFVLPQAIYDWLTGAIVPLPANVTQLLGTAWLTPGTAGTPDVNAKLWNGLTTVALPATPTNITAGTITTATNLTNAPTAGDLTATMKASVTTAATAATPVAASVTGAVGSVAAGGITAASIATDAIDADALAADALAEIKAQIVAALNTDTYAESSAVPAATATLVAKIAWLATLARNKITQTATTQLVRNDADGATVGTSTVSDDGTTFTRGKFA